MGTPRTMGGIAALAGAATNLLGLAVFVILLQPKGIGADDPDPTRIVGLLADNQAAMRAWYQIIYLAFGVCVLLLVLALHERLRAAGSVLAQATTVFGLIYAALVMVIGTLSIENLATVVRLRSESPARAETVWVTLTSVEDGLGAGGGETVVVSLWLLLLGWTALQAEQLPRLLSYLGLVVGGAGLVSVVLGSVVLMSVNGVGLIVWFAWLGIVLLRTRPVPVGGDAGHARPSRRATTSAARPG